jgi:diaminopropionate ammonia-lyase
MEIYVNHRNDAAIAGAEVAEAAGPPAFHRRLPEYAPTPLLDAPLLADRLGVEKIWIKDESRRLGLPSFKILGSSWALYRVLGERLGNVLLEPWSSIDELVERCRPLYPLRLVTATDGNHGRGVARLASLFGFGAHVFVPAGTAESRIDAIAGEGAEVTVVDGTYDEAVARAAEQEDERSLVLSDTAWPGYTKIPQWVMEGYTTCLQEVDSVLSARGESGPDIVFVQIGVGALAAAVVLHYRPRVTMPVRIVGIEPTSAACALTSAKAGRIVSLAESPHSIMAGLNCGTPSLVAWPYLANGIDVFAAIEDEWAETGMRELAAIGLGAGETGAAGLGGLLALFSDPDSTAGTLDVEPEATRVLVICTEGVTDPVAYQRIVGRSDV